MNESDFNAIVESRLETAVSEAIHGIRAGVTEEMTPLYVKEFKKKTGRHVTYNEEGFGELNGKGSRGAWTERLIEAAQDVKDDLQGEFDYRVRERIRDFKNDRVKDLRDELREEYRDEMKEALAG